MRFKVNVHNVPMLVELTEKEEASSKGFLIPSHQAPSTDFPLTLGINQQYLLEKLLQNADIPS